MFQCIQCKSPISTELPANSTDDYSRCEKCGEKYIFLDGYFKTFFDQKLFKAFGKKYLLNKVLNNNGFISYHLLKEGSISLSSRDDVSRFRDFVAKSINDKGSSGGDPKLGCRHRIIDIGCGPMKKPGYLSLGKKDYYEFIGLDPIDDNNFFGTRIVAASEFMPLTDESVDTIIFATSLDHVCDVKTTVVESHRILKDKGRVFVWMSDRTQPNPVHRILRHLMNLVRSVRLGYDTRRYTIYPNGTVLYTPPGGVDPFHSHFESPGCVIGLFKDNDFSVVDKNHKSKDEVFLCFEKQVVSHTF